MEIYPEKFQCQFGYIYALLVTNGFCAAVAAPSIATVHASTTANAIATGGGR